MITDLYSKRNPGPAKGKSAERGDALKPTILDKAIGFFDPVRAARRVRARAFMAIAGSYIGARYDRRATKEWFTSWNSADEDVLSDLPALRARSRDLVRNTPLATGAVNTVVQNVVGSGLSLMARPDFEALGWTEDRGAEWKAQVEREFRLWAETPECDVTRTQNFYQLAGLVFRSALESGDCFALLPMIGSPASPYSLRVQVVEGDRVDTPGDKARDPRFAAGVELDGNGAPVAYHIMRRHPGSLDGLKREFDRITAFGERTGRRNVLHIFERLRPGQNRGVPYLAPVIEPLKQLDKYTEAEVMAAVISSLFTVFVKSEVGDGLSSMAGSDGTASSDSEIKLGTGAIVDLAPGEDIVAANPQRPNAAFDPFVQAVLRQVGVALGLPFEVLIKHFTASYSAARAALLEAWNFFRLRREFLAATFCGPVFEAWMDEAVALGRVDAPGYFGDPWLRRAYLQADWIGDSPGSIDPVKEVDAAQKRVELGVSTLAEETLLLTGGVWADKHREQVRERRMRERDGLVQAAPQSGKPQPDDQGGSDVEKEDEA